MAKARKTKASLGPSTTLTVTIFGGVAPEPVDVTLFKGSEIILNEQHPVSFTRTFDNLLPDAIYSLFIAGKNPLTSDGATRCDLTTDKIFLHPPDDTPILKKGKQYLVEFHFTI